MIVSLMHDSHESLYRSPFGAVCCHEKIKLVLKISSWQVPQKVQVNLTNDRQCSWIVEMLLDRQEEEYFFYKAEITAPEDPGIIWYYFTAVVESGIYYCGSSDKAWQITVYEPFTVPQWFKNSVVYQIYVDRFYNPYQSVLNPRSGALVHANWGDKPYYIKDEYGKIAAYDFFGGNLAGIIEKLPYLQSLGISAIYLNPIFDAVSNHKYDTSDYHNVDSMYGNNEIFKELCIKAEKHGIRIILDGVFSHTGSDSIYFNKYGRFSSLGAYQDKNSPYYGWYKFIEYPNKYQCWWGIEDLPEVNELDSGYLEFLFNAKHGVVAKWMQYGAKGWRLDVADELPDEFIEKFKLVTKQFSPESIVIGEVWENAAVKVSYNKRRKFLWGKELDSVTNYPLRNIMIDFMLEKSTAFEVRQRIMELYEMYPREHFYSTLNLLSSHDVPRILTVLGESVDEHRLSSVERRDYKLKDDKRRKAIMRLKLLVLWQMTFPGVPCIYYGDEAGMEGLSDPYNRGTYPWGQEEKEVLAWYRQLINIRKRYCMFIDGIWEALPVNDEVFAFVRKKQDDVAVILINRSENVQNLQLCININSMVTDVLTGERAVIKDGMLNITLQALQGRLFINNIKFPDMARSSGILMHLTSLPDDGDGKMGCCAYKWIDFLKDSGQKLWQLLPINPVDDAGSPYSSCSAFAGNPQFISFSQLVSEGLLTDGDWSFSSYREILKKAYDNFLLNKLDICFEYIDFKVTNQYWLQDYACFMAMKDNCEGGHWTQFPKKINSKSFLEQCEFYCFVQYIFFRQWQNIKKYANKNGIRIIGDLPLYVNWDSADVWAHVNYFKLDKLGHPLFVSGAPPDEYNKQGQKWGHPVYDWSEMRKDGYKWWQQRICHALKLFDYIRIDHFRGFLEYWEIPRHGEAKEGHWALGPGQEFFIYLKNNIGNLPFIVEDLGYITSDVVMLREVLGFPGMAVRVFGDTDKIKSVFYSSTHDSDTLRGWAKSKDFAEQIIQKMFLSPAVWVIFPLQDILGLDNSARMNCPGEVADSNWRWRLTCFPGPDIQTKLKMLTLNAGRTSAV